MSSKIALINGPNLNLLGSREPTIYGSHTLKDIEQSVVERAKKLGFDVVSTQSNHEGELVDAIQKAGRECRGIIINPAAYTHTSVAIRDALAACGLPIIEVHISNIHRREEFRKTSLVSEVATGIICGLGVAGYLLACEALFGIIAEKKAG